MKKNDVGVQLLAVVGAYAVSAAYNVVRKEVKKNKIKKKIKRSAKEIVENIDAEYEELCNGV